MIVTVAAALLSATPLIAAEPANPGPANPGPASPAPASPAPVTSPIQSAPPSAQTPPAQTLSIIAEPVANTPSAPVPAAPAAAQAEASVDIPNPASEVSLDAIIVSAPRRASPGDPLARVNAQSYALVQDIDRGLVGPIAYAYRDGLPKPIRSGLHNLLRHLDEPVIFLNFLLQFKPGKALETVGRFTINSTLGVAGLMDVAKKRPFRMPYRPNGFADTMGYYGIGPGPYMYLPIVGPTTVRDLLGLWLDRGFLPFAVGKPFSHPTYSLGASVVRALDYRIEFDDALHRLNVEAADPYAATRAYYLLRRQAEIDGLHGKKTPMPMPGVTTPVVPATTPPPAVP